ncbi:MAG: hypothetical protein B7C24_13695 [Bacteroidetes bacterium 4572_77]|nr:MAG: hypothetical protein B7C24_13695 [Bacteroidetes bacterium 4572_77]
MARIPPNKAFSITYEDIINSYLTKLSKTQKDLPSYEDLSEKERVQLIAYITKKSKEDLGFFMEHIIQANVYWFHSLIFKLHIKYKNLCIVASRGLGKTYFATHILPIYHSFSKTKFYPDKLKPPKWHESMIIAYNEDMGKKFLSAPRDSIEENELLINLIGSGLNIDWNKFQLQMQNKSAIVTKSFSGAIRGFHEAGVVAIDDLLSDKSELSPKAVKRDLNNIVKPITRRFRARTVLVGTRFSEDDIYGDWEEKAKYDKKGLYGFIKLFVELDKEKQQVYICVEKPDGKIDKHLDTGITDIYDFDELEEAESDDPISFAREYGCEIVSDKQVPFPKNILMECRDYDLSYEIQKEKHRHYVGGLDSSNSIAKDADETVLALGYLDEDKNIVPTKFWADNTLTAPQRIEGLKKEMIKFGRPTVLAEKNSMGQTNIDFINHDNFHLIPFNTSRLSKIDITEFAEKFVKKKQIRLPYKTAEDREITLKLIHQLSGVREKITRTGLKSYNGTTKHDDYYIAFILMIKQLLDRAHIPTRVSSFTREDLKY